MKKILIATLLLLASLVEAKQFTVTYESVIEGFNSTSQFNEDEPLIIEIVLDNGNDNMISQTWTADDVVSVTFKFNSEPNTITSVFSSVEDYTAGDFATDGDGDLIEVPSEWVSSGDVSDTLVISTNDEYLTESYGDFDWYINGFNGVYHTDDQSNKVYDLDVDHNGDPAYWTLSKTKTSSSSGGGCTYNPNNKSIDMMFILLLLLAAAYPLRNKLIGSNN